MVDRWYTFHILYLYMSHTFYFILFYFILCIYNTVYFSFIVKRKAFPFWKQSFDVHVFIEKPDDTYNRPKLVAQNLQIKR
jgi:hypothetical protein